MCFRLIFMFGDFCFMWVAELLDVSIEDLVVMNLAVQGFFPLFVLVIKLTEQ